MRATTIFKGQHASAVFAKVSWDTCRWSKHLILLKLLVIEGPNMPDQIVFDAFHSFLVKGQTMLDTYLLCMHDI